jgi:hypothetical protein
MKIRFRQRFVAAAGAILGVLLAAPPTFAIPWVEAGDAGDLSAPQLVTGGPYDAISGNLGDTDINGVPDGIDTFKFHWSGIGAFSAKWSGPDFPDVGGTGGLLSGRFAIGLYDSANHVIAGLEENTATTGIATDNLAASDYTLLIIINSGQGLDPAYTIGFSGPIGDSGANGTGVPDGGSSILLLSCGLFALFCSRVRRVPGEANKP